MFNILWNRLRGVPYTIFIVAFIVIAVVVVLTLALHKVRPVQATARFSPGETLNPNCAPSDPDCTVLVPRLAKTFVVSDEASLNTLLDVEVGDHAEVSGSGKSFIRTQNDTWQELWAGSNTFVVPDLAALNALTDAYIGDHAVVTSLNKSFIKTQSGTWQELLEVSTNKTYVVADPAALTSLTNIQAGDHAEVTSLNKSFVRTQDGTWQELLADEDKTYVVADLATRDALTFANVGDFVVVTGINKSFIRTQNSTWQELLASPDILRLSNTYVVPNTAARDALTGLQSGDIAIITGANATYVYSQNGTWQQLLVPTVNQVLSVNNQTGNVLLTTDNVGEGATSMYFTNSRARAAITAADPLTYDAAAGIFGLNAARIAGLTGLHQQAAVQLNPFGTNPGNTSEIRFTELAAYGTNYVGFKAPDAIAADHVWTLPSSDGTNGQVLTTNGGGMLQWTTPPTGGSYSAGNGLQLTNSTFSLAAPVAVQNGGTGATNQATARTNLGLQIGTNVEAWSANLDNWATKAVPLGAAVGTTDHQTLGNKTLATIKLDSQVFTGSGTNDASPEWNGVPIVILNAPNSTQVFNLGACSQNTNSMVSIYVRDTNNKARTINATNAEGIVPFSGGAKVNITMKNSANGDIAAATFYCDGTEWLVISQTKR